MTEKGIKISRKTKGKKRTEEQRKNISLGVRKYLQLETEEKKEERLKNQREACKIKSMLYKEYIKNNKPS